MSKNPKMILALPRSGTNWTVDVLKSKETRILQEPLWLHNGGQYEQNPLHPMRSSTSEDVSKDLGHKSLLSDPYGQLLVKNFFDWMNSNDGRTHIFKETDGFFHLEWLLQSLPNLKILLIRRDIRGIVSSFKQGSLFEKWDYRRRLRELLRTIKASNQLDTLYGGIINHKNINAQPWIALTYYLGASTLEIRRQMARFSKDLLTVNYKDILANPETCFSNIAQTLEIADISAVIERVKRTTKENRAESTHSTRKRKHRDSFEKLLNKKEADDVQSIWHSLGLKTDKLPRTFWEGVADWTQTSNNDYIVCNSSDRKEIFGEYYENRVMIPGKDYVWTTETLVTNSQYAHFINWLQKNGISISINGRNVFYNDRPQSKIHLVDGVCVINKGFENHPATHMNLIGAASFARWLGGKLPKSKDVEAVCFLANGKAFEQTLDKSLANFGHHYPSTTAVRSFPKNHLGIYDPVGNTGIWIAESYKINGKYISNLEYSRMCGAWSKDSDECNINNTTQGRPWWMAASTLGLRPIFTGNLLPNLDTVLNEITNLLEKLQSISLGTELKNQAIHNYVTQ